ncbi:MAG: hypothetical protein Q7U78_03985 [Gallionella sp.]|nr:hypothetical protein [Gallionella sp.]
MLRDTFTAYWRVSEVRVIDDYAVQVRFMDGLEVRRLRLQL